MASSWWYYVTVTKQLIELVWDKTGHVTRTCQTIWTFWAFFPEHRNQGHQLLQRWIRLTPTNIRQSFYWARMWSWHCSVGSGYSFYAFYISFTFWASDYICEGMSWYALVVTNLPLPKQTQKRSSVSFTHRRLLSYLRLILLGFPVENSD